MMIMILIFGDDHFDNLFKNINLLISVDGIGNKNFRVYIQNQYGMFILN